MSSPPAGGGAASLLLRLAGYGSSGGGAPASAGRGDGSFGRDEGGFRGGRRDFDRPMAPPRPLRPPSRKAPNFPIQHGLAEEERRGLIEKHVRFYFSDENMYVDDNIRILSERRRGFVPINALLYFRTLFSVQATPAEIVRACEGPLFHYLELSQAADMVRRREPLSQPGFDAFLRRTVWLSKLSVDATASEYAAHFNQRLRAIDAGFEVTAVRFFPREPGSPFVNANISCNSLAAADCLQRLSPVEVPVGAVERYLSEVRAIEEPRYPLWLPPNQWHQMRPTPPRRGGRGGPRGGGGGGRGGPRGGRGGGDFAGRGGTFAGRGRGGHDPFDSREKRPHYDGRDDRRFSEKRGRF